MHTLNHARGLRTLLVALLIVSLLLLSFFFKNSILIVAAVILYIGVRSLWEVDSTKIFTFIFCYQWLQASALAIQAEFHGVNIDDFAQLGGSVSLATWYTLGAISILAFGIKIGLKGVRNNAIVQKRNFELQAIKIKYWFFLYVFATVISVSTSYLSQYLGGLKIILLALANLKWGFFWLLAYMTFSGSGKPKSFLYFSIIVELASSFGAFFADFKTVLIVAGIGILSAGIRLTIPKALKIVVIMLLVVSFGVIWTSIKVEYRGYLRDTSIGGVTTRSDQGQYLVDKIFDLNNDDLLNGWKKMVERIGYVEFFGRVLDYVPKYYPHESGALWLDAFLRPLMPRLFFPDKSSIDDSVRTARYVDYGANEIDADTSISIGYIGESYIDFGFPLMYLPIFAWGYFAARIYRYFSYSSRVAGPVGQAVAIALLLPFAILESSITKVVGGVFAGLIVAWLFSRFVLPRFQAHLIRLSRSNQ